MISFVESNEYCNAVLLKLTVPRTKHWYLSEEYANAILTPFFCGTYFCGASQPQFPVTIIILKTEGGILVKNSFRSGWVNNDNICASAMAIIITNPVQCSLSDAWFTPVMAFTNRQMLITPLRPIPACPLSLGPESGVQTGDTSWPRHRRGQGNVEKWW